MTSDAAAQYDAGDIWTLRLVDLTVCGKGD